MSLAVSAEENRRAYTERKNQVLQLLENTKNYYLQENNSSNAEVFEKLYKDLENGEFSIVVVGEFSAGKSTLLNARRRKRILPSFSDETTATVNFLRHCDKSEGNETGKVFYNDGTQKILKDASLGTIMEYVSTRGTDVAKNVEHLDLYLDSEFLKDGVTLVDSPGLNGNKEGHREITKAQILKSHASIFLFNSDHPGSKTDFDFLHELQSKVKTIILVLNKIDAIKADEGETPETVIETLKQSYKKRFPDATSVPEIWPVAAYPALVARNSEPLMYHEKIERTEEEKKKLEEFSRMKEFEDRLFSFLTCGEKAKQQLLSPVERVIALTMESRDDYEKEKKILEGTADMTEIDDQIFSLKESINGLEKQIADSRNEVSTKIKEALRDVYEELTTQMMKLQDRKLGEIDEFENLEDLQEYAESFEKSFIRSVQRVALSQEEKLRDAIRLTVKMQYVEQAGKIEAQMSDQNTKITLSVREHFESNEKIFEVGLNEMDNKVKSLEKQLNEVNAGLDEIQDDFYQARKKEKKRAALNRQLMDLHEKQELLESQMLPPVEVYQTVEKRNVERGGILGKVATFVIGEKKEEHTILKKDTTNYDIARKERDQKLENVFAEIKNIQSEVAKVEESNPLDSDQLHSEKIKKMAQADALRNKIESVEKENTEKINARYNKQVKKIRRNLTEYCDSITDELSQEVKKELKKEEAGYIELVLGAVEAVLKNNLEEKKNHLEQLENRLKASEKDKNHKIEILQEKIGKIQELLNKASDLESDLEEIPVDQIQQQTI